MKLTKKKAATVKSAVESWSQAGMVSGEQRLQLLQSLEIVQFDWKRLAKYSFWISIICLIIALGSVLADDVLMELLERLFNASDMIKCICTAGIAAFFYAYGMYRKDKQPEKTFSNEAIFFLGVLATAGSIAFLGMAIDTGSGHFSLLILLASIIYGMLGLYFPSKLIWIFSLLSIGSWMGTETGYMSGWGAYYLGMNFPLRFVVFGLAITVASCLFEGWAVRKEFLRPTRIIGLLNVFIALWIMSIFGNYGDMHHWEAVKQIQLLHWSLLFAIAAVAAIYHGIKEDDGMTRGFGITFLFLNLYTRFFEYFWDATHKAIFFAILAVSFWVLGSRAEKIWTLGDLVKIKKSQEKSTSRLQS